MDLYPAQLSTLEQVNEDLKIVLEDFKRTIKLNKNTRSKLLNRLKNSDVPIREN